MKKLIIVLFAVASLGLNAQENYKISRYEKRDTILFICINSTVTPSYIEHFFTQGEQTNSDSIKVTIEKLLADLMIKSDDYVNPEPLLDKKDEAGLFVFSKANIAKLKAKKLKAKKLKAKKLKAKKLKEDIELSKNIE